MPPRVPPTRSRRAAAERGRAPAGGGRAAGRRGRGAGRGGRGPVTPPVQEEEMAQQASAQVQFDWEQAIRQAAGGAIPPEALEAGIRAARRLILDQQGDALEGAGSVAQSPAQTVYPVVHLADSEAPPGEAEERRRREQLRSFKRLDPPIFTGKGTAIEAQEWIREIRKDLTTMGVTRDQDMVRLAAFQLRAEGDQWWESETRTRRPETFTWDAFVTAFYVRFFPRAVRQQLVDRYNNLRQGYNQSVQAYHASFIQIGRFAPQTAKPDEVGVAWTFLKC